MGIIGIEQEKIDDDLESLMLFTKIEASNMVSDDRNQDFNVIFIDDLVFGVEILKDQDKANDGIEEFGMSFNSLKEFFNMRL